MIQGAFEAAVMYKMRELRGDKKYNLDDIKCEAEYILCLQNREPNKEELIYLVSIIGNMLED